MNHFIDYDSSNRKLDQLNNNKTIVHELNPVIKIVITILFLAMILSYSPYDLDGLFLYCAFLILTIFVAQIPISNVIKKIIMTLPFLVMIGISNLIIDKKPIFIIEGIVLTQGMISFLSMILKTSMSVSIIYILVATTETTKLIMGFRMLRIPNLFLVQLELTIRYISVLVDEARNMYYAYRLRTPGLKGIILRHMGEFLGQLLLKSIYRSERIYHGMKCRGYRGSVSIDRRERLHGKDYLQMVILVTLLLLCRFIKVF